MNLISVRTVVLATALFFGYQASASVVITGTRVIYPLTSANVTVRLQNDGSKPSLVQAWADEGDPNVAPDQSRAPFVVSPPVFRMEPHAGQSLRLTLTNKSLPADRESVYWLNVLDIPPKPSQAVSNYLQMAVRTRIKIFVRPGNLQPSVQEAANQLKWEAASGNQLVIHNPTPYYFSLNGVSNSGFSKSGSPLSSMVAPFSSLTVATRSISFSGSSLNISYINDYGGVSEASVSRKSR